MDSNVVPFSSTRRVERTDHQVLQEPTPDDRSGHPVEPAASGPEPEQRQGGKHPRSLEGGQARVVVTWEELERVADEAADLDAIVQRELTGLAPAEPIPVRALTHDEWPRRRRWPTRLLIIVAVLGLATIIANNSLGDRSAPTTRTGHGLVPSSAPSPAPSRPSGPTRTRTIQVRLAFSAPCWVLAVADGRIELKGTLATGTRIIRARHALELTLGNAGGVVLTVNGKAVPTGSSGEVMRFSFELKHGELLEKG